jgi:membrane protease YdiL (CAAX protease family)
MLAALAASAVAMESLEGIPVAALGIPVDAAAPRELGRGFLLGAGLIGLAVLVLALTGSVTWRPAAGAGVAGWSRALLGLGFFLLVAAFFEELLLRGYPLQALAERYGGVVAIGVTSAAFAVLHAGNPGLGRALLEGPSLAEILPLVNLGLAGVVLGLAYWRTYSLWFATGVHFGWNWIMGFAADLPVSGLEPGQPGYALFDTPGFDAVVTGPQLWTGGSFGPEGGLAVTAASLLGIGWLATTGRLRRSIRVRALNPLPDRGTGSDGGVRDEGGDRT